MIARDFLGCVGWAALVLLASVSLPIVGPFISLLTPIPFLYYATKLGFYRGLKLAVAAVFFISLVCRFLGQPQIILFSLEFSALGMALAEIFRRKFSIGQTLAAGTLSMVVVGIACLSLVGLFRHMGPFEMIQSYLKTNLNQALEMYKGMGLEQDKAVEIKAYAKAFIETIARIYPALLVVGSGFVVWLNVMLGRYVLRRAGLEYPVFPDIDRWQAPEIMIWGLIAAGFSLFLRSDVIRLLAMNGLIILMTVYLFQGISILIFFLNKHNAPAWVRGIIWFLLLFQQIFLLLVAMAGVFDQWVDFRKIHKKLVS
jgi:uncharacterized protein YybS (DUF2232 family)